MAHTATARSMAVGDAPVEQPLPRPAKGSGKGPPPPPPARTTRAPGKGTGAKAPSARGAGAPAAAAPLQAGARRPAESAPAAAAALVASRLPLRVRACLMDGREIPMELQPDSLVKGAQSEVASVLGIRAARVRLVLGAAKLDSFGTVEESGVHDGASLMVVVLPPVYGTLDQMGISPPDSILTLKADLHSELAMARAGPA